MKNKNKADINGKINFRCSYCEDPEVQRRIIIRTEHAFAFPTYIPIVPGHVIICTNRCVPKISDLKEEEIGGVIQMIDILQPALKKLFGANGFNFAWNEGSVAGQSVPHFHLHMLPRKKGDAGITKYEPREFLYRPGSRETTPETELRKICSLIRSNIKRK